MCKEPIEKDLNCSKQRLKFKQKVVSVFVVATVLASSTALFVVERKYTAPILTENTCYTVAHAGGGLENENGKLLTYLNCKEGFEYYYQNGTRMFEFDMVFSSDGKLVGIHNFEYLKEHDFDNRISYDDYRSTKIAGKYTGITEDGLLDLIQSYPDCKFIIDTKEKDDMSVYARFANVAEQKGVDIDKAIVPFVSSVEMLEEVEERYDYQEYMFTNYKEEYGNKKLLGILDSNSKIKYLHVFPYDFTFLNIDAVNQRGVRVFAHMDKSNLTKMPLNFGCTGIFTDDISENYYTQQYKPYMLSKLKLTDEQKANIIGKQVENYSQQFQKKQRVKSDLVAWVNKMSKN